MAVPKLRYRCALLALSCRMIDLDKFDMWKFRSKAQTQSIETGARNNYTLMPLGKRCAAALFDPKLAVPIVRRDARLYESF